MTPLYNSCCCRGWDRHSLLLSQFEPKSWLLSKLCGYWYSNGAKKEIKTQRVPTTDSNLKLSLHCLIFTYIKAHLCGFGIDISYRNMTKAAVLSKFFSGRVFICMVLFVYKTKKCILCHMFFKTGKVLCLGLEMNSSRCKQAEANCWVVTFNLWSWRNMCIPFHIEKLMKEDALMFHLLLVLQCVWICTSAEKIIRLPQT